MKLPLGNALLHYAKENNLETQHYKIVIGVNAELQRAVLQLREAGRKYNEARRDEEANYRTQKLIGIYQTGRNTWLKKMMKVSIQVCIVSKCLNTGILISANCFLSPHAHIAL